MRCVFSASISFFSASCFLELAAAAAAAVFPWISSRFCVFFFVVALARPLYFVCDVAVVVCPSRVGSLCSVDPPGSVCLLFQVVLVLLSVDAFFRL